jgi:DNA helicase-2/ATP-dependent DNA helicase PcrA
MSELHPIVAEELRLLADVHERLGRAAPSEGASEDDIIEELRRIQDDIRTAKTEDKAALEQQYDRQCRLLEQLRRGKQVEGVDPESPYFAHIRTAQEGRESDVLLGRATCLDSGLRIVDWRHAPVAKLYYRYQEGDEYAEDIGHRVIEGRVLARRAVSVNHGQLGRILAPQGTFLREHGAWVRHERVAPRLASGAGAAAVRAPAQAQRMGSGKATRADKHLPDIAALIDPAQFELITQADSGPVVIRGGAGSGKTTVALHRIAWLAYANPQRFAPYKMLVVVWGKALRDYVSKVLPNLGVHGVGVVTWSDWSRKLVERHFPYLPGHKNANTPSVVSRVKLHPKLPRLLEDLVRSRKAPPTGESAYDDWRLLVADSARLAELGDFSPSEIDQVMTWQRQQLDHLARRREEHDRTAEPWLDEEDDAILLRAWQLRVGELRAKGGGTVRYSHVMVDEVQDFAAMEVAVLLGATDKWRNITLAGDTQQHILEQGGSEGWTSLLDSLRIESTALSTLRVSYRSTRQITSFARQVLGSLAEDEGAPLTTREGAPVELFDFPEHGACVDFLGGALRDLIRAEPLASIAVVAPDEATARLYYDGLDAMEVPLLRLVEDQTFAFAPGIDVVDVRQIKGLEFDYVVVVGASAGAYPDRPTPRRLLHVATTRAIHQLWVTWVGTPSPLLGAAS